MSFPFFSCLLLNGAFAQFVDAGRAGESALGTINRPLRMERRLATEIEYKKTFTPRAKV
jgi:hypothetical protein